MTPPVSEQPIVHVVDDDDSLRKAVKVAAGGWL
jgi:FixJ family two-component response regulator